MSHLVPPTSYRYIYVHVQWCQLTFSQKRVMGLASSGHKEGAGAVYNFWRDGARPFQHSKVGPSAVVGADARA